MPRKPSKTLTEAEQRLMEVLWDHGRASVAGVLERLHESDRPAFNSVQTLLRILEEKRYVRHVREGRAFIYIPVVERADASRAAVDNVVERFFERSAQMLAAHLVRDERMSDADLDHLQALIDEARAK